MSRIPLFSFSSGSLPRRVIGLLLWLLPGCMGLVVQSTWVESESAGLAPWQGSLSSLGERDASMCVQNDGGFLYLVFTTTDPGLRERIAGEGIFFWFDPFGGERRFFGIRYPVAWSPAPAPGDDGSPAGADTSALRGAGWGKPGDEMEVYTDGLSEHERIGLKDAGGIRVRLVQRDDTLRCEVRMPLRPGPGNPYALGSAPGAVIGVGFETRDVRFSGGSSASPATRSRRGRSTSPGSGSAGGSGSIPGSEIPFRVWTKVQLSSR